jgi:hypothetical protein
LAYKVQELITINSPTILFINWIGKKVSKRGVIWNVLVASLLSLYV